MNENNFNEIYQGLYPKVYRLCLGYVNGEEDLAKDLCQQTFVKAWSHRRTFKGDSDISTWIYRIAVNSCLGHLKKKRPVFLNSNAVIAEVSDDSESETEKERDIAELYHCIEKLSPLNKSLILLELEEVPQEIIAATLGHSHGSIRTRLSRIRKSLLKCITHEK